MPLLRLDLPAATASGIGSLPGTSARDAAGMVLHELTHLPYLPELPERGPGADLIGRAFGVLTEMYASVAPSGWRFADHPGRDSRRAVSFLDEDLDALEERGQEYEGAIKVQVAGPWTLAANVELHYGDKALADRGACRDIAASLADGLRAHVAEVRKRVPRATAVIVQLDEPALADVLRGGVRTASGFGKLSAVEPSVVESRLLAVVQALTADGVATIVYCGAADAPVALLDRAGVAGVAIDMSMNVDHESWGSYLESGGVLLAGITPGTVRGPFGPVRASIEPVRAMWNRIGLPTATLARVIPVPSGGLTGTSPQYAHDATRHCVEAADLLAETAGA